MHTLEEIQSLYDMAENNLTPQELNLLGFYNVWKEVCEPQSKNKKKETATVIENPVYAQAVMNWQEIVEQDMGLYPGLGIVIFKKPPVPLDSEAMKKVYDLVGNFECTPENNYLAFNQMARAVFNTLEEGLK